MSDARALVVGATGQLGSVIVRQLVASGARVRALARNADKLASAAAGAELAPTDLRDVRKLTEACAGVDTIIATANNNLSSGASSPTRIDLAMYQNLCAAARNAGVRRLIYVSYRGAANDSPVDIFRVKWYIEDAIKRSGVPFVMLRPSAFMDVWIDQLLAPGIRDKGVATIFGDGERLCNYIAVDDVAAFAVKIFEAQVANETIDVGGPSDVSQNDLATLIERHLNKRARRRHVPVAAMRLLPPLIRPFNEVTARLMTLGFYSATMATPFPNWQAAANRFSISPRSVERHIDQLK